jgi:hypothetical protein
MRQAVAPSFLPRSSKGEFELVLMDLDIDPQAPTQQLVEAVALPCPETPVVAIAGVNARHRLVQALASPTVVGLVPKIGTWLESASSEQAPSEGADEQELGVALRRSINPASIPPGPVSYLLGETTIEERVIGSSGEKEEVLAEVMALAARFGLSDKKLRRIKVAADELLLNAIYDAPRDEIGRPKFAGIDRSTPVTLGAQTQVRLRYGCDGARFVVSVCDRFGSLTRAVLGAHIQRVLEVQGPRPRSGTAGAGLGLVLVYTSSNQLVVHVSPGRFTEITSVLFVAGSNQASVARGSSLHWFFP